MSGDEKKKAKNEKPTSPQKEEKKTAPRPQPLPSHTENHENKPPASQKNTADTGLLLIIPFIIEVDLPR
ncbi:MAG: hypothetical protein R3C61_14255 [Bacteroidia bacterium]